jgi:hypothetical protein
MLTHDIALHTISYTICNSWVLGPAASFITRRAWSTRHLLVVLPCFRMLRQTRRCFSTTCSAISSTPVQSFRTCIHTGLPLTLTSLRTWEPHTLCCLAHLRSQRPTIYSTLQRSVWQGLGPPPTLLLAGPGSPRQTHHCRHGGEEGVGFDAGHLLSVL